MASEKTDSKNEGSSEFREKYLKANGWITAEGSWYHPRLSKAMTVKEAENLQLHNDTCSLVYVLEKALERPNLKKMLGEQLLDFVMSELAHMAKDPEFQKSVVKDIKEQPAVKKILSEMNATAKQQIRDVVKEVLTEDVS